jgi:hypothetical protein
MEPDDLLPSSQGSITDTYPEPINSVHIVQLHFPSQIPIFRRFNRSKKSIHVRQHVERFVTCGYTPRPNPQDGGPSFSEPAAVYSIYSQLQSTSAGRLLHLP